MKIYVASSWRNIYQPEVVKLCRAAGHEVYDFRNPGPDDNGFGWSEIDKEWKSWDYERYRKLLGHKRAEQGFALDMGALRWCDACVLIYPCGKSAHLEMGWACGAGKHTAFFVPNDVRGDPSVVKGHSATGPCGACGDLDGCWLPGKLQREFEPELMVKMADAFLIGTAELRGWLTETSCIVAGI